MLIVDRRYVFFHLGGNQVRTSERNKLYSQILDIVVTVRQSNPLSRIFFIGVLPRLVDNEDIKPFIVRFNHWLAAVVNEVNNVFEKVKFLPVQLHFIAGTSPRAELFDVQNRLLLNNIGGSTIQTGYIPVSRVRAEQLEVIENTNNYSVKY